MGMISRLLHSHATKLKSIKARERLRRAIKVVSLMYSFHRGWPPKTLISLFGLVGCLVGRKVSKMHSNVLRSNYLQQIEIKKIFQDQDFLIFGDRLPLGGRECG